MADKEPALESVAFANGTVGNARESVLDCVFDWRETAFFAGRLAQRKGI